ncbi:MAG: L-histidine N(alpha)-methyltransferase [Bacteroidetes bacterium]|nr:L-histidine N(alpha)-methyltransferase [Bacteroidota bacterium]
MNEKITTGTIQRKTSAFGKDVMYGLSQHPKSLSSKYFYDAEGDKIFQQIMNMPEYYLTNCEYEILSQQRKDICDAIHALDEPLNLIEFGAGDGYKTKLLLKYLLDNKAEFNYYPVDISNHILDELQSKLHDEMPDLDVKPVNLEYFEALTTLSKIKNRRNVVLFLGANIGNFRYKEAENFIGRIHSSLNEGDLLLMGVDLRKNPNIIRLAYDDPHGITASFNLNLLKRMNRELGADFKTDSFSHYAFYEPVDGEMLSYLVSKKDQVVHFDALEWSVEFNKDEFIHTEVSKKYSISELEMMAESQHFKVMKHFFDGKQYFVDTLWKLK